jgi:hypothetical protein
MLQNGGLPTTFETVPPFVIQTVCIPSVVGTSSVIIILVRPTVGTDYVTLRSVKHEQNVYLN